MGVNDTEELEYKLRIVRWLGHSVVPGAPIVFFLIGFLQYNTYDKSFVYIIPAQVSGMAVVLGPLFGLWSLVAGIWAYREKCWLACIEGLLTTGLLLLMLIQLNVY